MLDDLGLLPAIRHYLRGYQTAPPASRFQVGLDQEQLPAEVGGVVSHYAGGAVSFAMPGRSVNVLLEHRQSIVLIVEMTASSGLGAWGRACRAKP